MFVLPLAPALLALALCYVDVRGVTKDEAQAASWFR
jgi:hypothetical protein